MALLHSTKIPLGTLAHDFELPGVDGKTYTLSSFANQKILVLIFMCNHCPYVKAVLQRLIDLQNSFSKYRVQLAGINSNDATRYPDDSFDNMKAVAQERGVSFPYLFDETQETAKVYGAVCTPDLYVYGEERKLLYQGRIDDNWKHPELVTRQDLKSALEDILAGRPVPNEQTPSMGCSIKWKTS